MPFSSIAGASFLQGVGAPSAIEPAGTLYFDTESGTVPSRWWQSTGSLLIPYSSLQLTDGAVHQYLLDDSTTTAVDTGSSPSNGTYSGTYTQGQTPLSGISYQYSTYFNGGHMACPFVDGPGMSGTNPWTIEFLYEPVSGGNFAMGNSHTDSDNKGIEYYAFGSTFYIGNGSSSIQLNHNVLASGTNYFAITYDGTNAKVYVNGNLRDTKALSAYAGGTGAAFWFGDNSGYNSPAPSKQAGIAFYSQCLSQAEITAHANAVSVSAPPWLLLAQ